MQPIHVYIAEPTRLATARPQDGAGVMSVGAAKRVVADGGFAPQAWSTNTSSRSRTSKPLTCDGTLHMGGGLQSRIEVNPV